MEDKLKGIIGEERLDAAKKMDSMLSVVKEGIAAGKHNAKYMHDITEGGVYGAAWEASVATKKGVLIYENQIPFMDITLEIASILNINPYRLISSGSMLMIIGEEDLRLLQQELNQYNIKATAIGEIIEDGIYLIKDGVKSEITPPESDELYKALKEK